MNRRSFIKWLAVLLSMIAGMLWALIALLQQAADVNRRRDAGAEKAGATPLPSAPAQTAEPIVTEPVLSFFILSDPHISGDLPKHTERMKRALDDIASFESKVESIVITGDLTDFGRDVDYQLLRNILDGYKLPPLYANMGNHDYYHIWLDAQGQFSAETVPNGKTDAESRARFQTFMGQERVYRDVWVNGVHLILLSQDVYVQEKDDVGEGAWHSDAQLDWLREKMLPHRDGSPAFIMIHQPLPAEGQDGGSHRLIRANRFRDIVRPYPNVFVFSGHHHREITEGHYEKHSSFHWFHNSSVTRVRSMRQLQNDFSQGLYVQVYPNQVVLRGREFSNRTWIEGAYWSIPLQA